MQIQLAIYKADETQLLADWSNRVTSCHVRTGIHGYESCEANISIPFLEAFLYYQQLGPLVLRVSWGGNHRVWEGRLEDPTQFAATVSGLKVTAFGGWVALNDETYTALWSTSQIDAFVEATGVMQGAYQTALRWKQDKNDRLLIALVKGNTYGLNQAAGYLMSIPHLSSRTIVGIQFSLEQLLPTTFTTRVVSYTSDISGALSGGAVEASLIGTAALQNRAYHLILSSKMTVGFDLNCNTAGTPAGETGDNYQQITNLRIVTSTTNRINTTLTANRNLGTNVTATVGSTVGMYVGMKLVISSGNNPSEIVTVLSIGSATQFNATFISNYVTNNTVQGFVVYPDEIIKDCVSIVSALNPTQLSSDVGFIQSQGVDLDQAIYEDQYPTEIINELLTKSDDQTPPRQWVALVYDDQRLIVRPRGTGFAWFTDITSLDVVRTLTELYNSVYAVYKDASNKRNLRTVPNTDVASTDKFQITRKKPIHVDTTSATQATSVRDSVLALQLDPIPRAKITVDKIYDASGTPFPVHFIRADDTLTLRNLPPILGTVYDKIRTLVITRTDVDLIDVSISSLELEIPMPDIGVQLARALKGK